MEGESTSGAGRVLALLCLVLASAPCDAAQGTLYSRGEVYGTLRIDSAAKQVNSVTVTLETALGEVIDRRPVSNDGRFRFDGLQRGNYLLIATAEGCEPYRQTVDLTDPIARASVDITLKPASSSALPTANLPSRTDAQAPTKARKEWQKGVRAAASQKLGEAQTHFEKAVAAYPCYAQAQTDLAVILMLGKQSAHAEAPLKKSFECDPDYVDAYLHLGRLLNGQQRFTESRRVLAEGVRRAPSSWFLYFQLGQADFGLKAYPNAEQEYRKAQSFGLAVPSVIPERLAAIYLNEGEYNKAYTEMQAYLAADPKGTYAASIRAVMQKLQSAGLVHPPSAQPPSR